MSNISNITFKIKRLGTLSIYAIAIQRKQLNIETANPILYLCEEKNQTANRVADNPE
ncbi:MAG: hypothetical protein ACYCS0_01195 [bacterium]